MSTKQHQMSDNVIQKIKIDPRFVKLVKTRNRLSFILTILMLFFYFGFIGLISFDKALLAKQIGGTVMTYGIPFGFFMIVISVFLTWIFVRKANGEFDNIKDELINNLPTDTQNTKGGKNE